ncbi:beta-propeller fold lactonase family protein [Cupriavidus pauculus]|uniref:6-phosphogluconolactonase n=1 Tax=Cupriavidus pauculus TaxID=82633 RepID=A0A2N5CB96_9BURK|nr:beta-propeller fold lactonase family protein [Cupriavidus pauculus]PLP99510.1 hypothetical protein CYJ10_17010 [Cupriavidus pauculus]
MIAAGARPTNLIIDAAGRHLYAISRGSNEIWQFRIAADRPPMLMTLLRVPTGMLPGKPSFDPTGRFLYVPSGAGLEQQRPARG